MFWQVEVDKQVFRGTGPNKKVAKASAALAALNSLFTGSKTTTNKKKRPNPPVSKVQLQSTWSDTVRCFNADVHSVCVCVAKAALNLGAHSPGPCCQTATSPRHPQSSVHQQPARSPWIHPARWVQPPELADNTRFARNSKKPWKREKKLNESASRLMKAVVLKAVIHLSGWWTQLKKKTFTWTQEWIESNLMAPLSCVKTLISPLFGTVAPEEKARLV